jgi:hypothetical protein
MAKFRCEMIREHAPDGRLTAAGARWSEAPSQFAITVGTLGGIAANGPRYGVDQQCHA